MISRAKGMTGGLEVFSNLNDFMVKKSFNMVNYGKKDK